MLESVWIRVKGLDGGQSGVLFVIALDTRQATPTMNNAAYYAGAHMAQNKMHDVGDVDTGAPISYSYIRIHK